MNRKRHNKFTAKEIPLNAGKLTAVVNIEDNETEEDIDHSIEILDCKSIYPELITDNTPIGGPNSVMYCLKPD